VEGEQGTPQDPIVHVCLKVAQFWQMNPPVPQAPSSVPARQVFPVCPPQQPAQFCGVQGVPTMHVPPTQIIEPPQSTHAAPFWPHAVGDSP
jgi:hypothetical protein